MIQHLGYLWAVTLIVWGGTLAYVVVVLRKQTRVQRQLTALESRVEELHKRETAG